MSKYKRLFLKAELEIASYDLDYVGTIPEEELKRNLINTVEDLGIRVVTIELKEEEK